MLRSAKLLGLDMSQRTNRRVLVLSTYGLLFAITVAFSLIAQYRAGLRVELLTVGIWFFTTAWFLVAHFVFGRIASPFLMTPLIGRPPHRIDRGLGLSATVPPEEPPPDERDVALRNSAYYIAYQIFVAVCMGGLIALPAFELASPPAQKAFRFSAVILIAVLAFTLPQAVVLWREKEFQDT